MKKLNNKGFAISTLIYGLAIMSIMIVAILMATMAQTRSNNSNLAKSIEEDLNRYSRTETSFKPIGPTGIQEQQYIVPESGWYKIELWGAQGGSTGGKGAYTSGVIELEEGEVLYFYVGKSGGSGGGYASEVRLNNGSYTDPLSYETRIMVAAGGGSTATALGGTLYGYNDSMNSYGGFIYSQGNNKDFSLISPTATNPPMQNTTTNGTLVGYNKNYAVNNNAPTAQKNVYVQNPRGSNGGGDGYFPSHNSAYGGTSYIAGYAGCYGIRQGRITGNSKFEYYEHQYNETDAVGTDDYGEFKGNFYFVDGIMIAGTHTGDGYAKIARVKPKNVSSTALVRKNPKLNNITSIRDCTTTPNPTWIKAVASVKGESIEMTPSGSGTCRTFNLGSAKSVDEIVVFHNSGIDYEGHTMEVLSGGNWLPVKAQTSLTTLSETESVVGYRVSAYQYDSTGVLPESGNYIIQPVLSENKVLTAPPTSETSADPITIEPYNGEKRQKWTVELITDKRVSPGYIPGNPSTYEYKIVESSRFKALSINQDENMIFNTLSAIDKFNDHARNEPQIWKVVAVGNGTYIIETVVQQANPSANSGFILPQTNQSVSDAKNQLIIGKKNADTARFKLIQIDYSSN